MSDMDRKRLFDRHDRGISRHLDREWLAEERIAAIGLTPSVLEQLVAYTDLADGEVGGFGLIEVDQKQQMLRVGELLLPKQTVTYGSVDVAADAIADMLMDLETQNKDSALVKLQWHSHGRMDPFHSGIDRWSVRQVLRNVDWFVALVTSKGSGLAGIRGAIAHGSPVRTGLVELPVTLCVSDAVAQACQGAYAAKVTRGRTYQYDDDERGYASHGRYIWRVDGDGARQYLLPNTEHTREESRHAHD